MILKNVSRNLKLNSEWYLTNEYPFYFIKEVGKDSYEAVSLFFADNNVVLEHHKINYFDVPETKKSEVTSEISLDMGDKFLKLSIIESSLNDGLGESLFYESYNNSIKSINDINDFLCSLGLEVKIEESDFSY